MTLCIATAKEQVGHVDSHPQFFDELNWFDEQMCTRLDGELQWARAECPVVHTRFGGGAHIVTHYDDPRTVAEHPEIFSSATPGELFTLDAEGYIVLGDGIEVSTGKEQSARLGVDACPVQALRVE